MKTQNTAPTRKTKSMFERIANTAGRFFGLTLQTGEKINAQYRSQSDRYLVVYDRNRSKNRRLSKTSVVDATV